MSLGAYFVIGALVMALHYKRSGSEIVPNKNFWVQFPLLIKVANNRLFFCHVINMYTAITDYTIIIMKYNYLR